MEEEEYFFQSRFYPSIKFDLPVEEACRGL